MKTLQTPQFMADLLRKIQVLQVAVTMLNGKYSLHVDQSTHRDFETGERYSTISVTLFNGNGIEEDWDFSAIQDAAELNHELDNLAFTISRL